MAIKSAGHPCPALFALASMLVSAAMIDLPDLNTYIMLINTMTVFWTEALEEEINIKT